jgi:transposase
MPNTAQQKDSWKDRRLYGRSHVLWGARLLSGAGEQDCVILDLSAAGAMLRLSDPSVSPAHVAVSTDRFGKLRGRVMWQQGNVVGLRFSERPQLVARTVDGSLPQLRTAS